MADIVINNKGVVCQAAYNDTKALHPVRDYKI